MSEAIYSFVNLIGLYHERLLNRPPLAALVCERKFGHYTPTTTTAHTLLIILTPPDAVWDTLASHGG